MGPRSLLSFHLGWASHRVLAGGQLVIPSSSPLLSPERVTWRSLLEETAAVRLPKGDSGRRMAQPSPSTPPISLEWAAWRSWQCAQPPVRDNRLCRAGGGTRSNCLMIKEVYKQESTEMLSTEDYKKRACLKWAFFTACTETSVLVSCLKRPATRQVQTSYLISHTKSKCVVCFARKVLAFCFFQMSQ